MKRESGEAFWYAQRVVDVERFRRSHCRCLLPSPPLRFPLCLSLSLSVYLSVCLSVCLSVFLCLLYGGLGCSPVWAACHLWGYSMYSLPCASYLFFSLSSRSVSVLSPRCFLFSFLFFFFFNLRLTFTVWRRLLSQSLQMGVQAGWRAVTQPLSGAFWGPRCCLLYMIAVL